MLLCLFTPELAALERPIYSVEQLGDVLWIRIGLIKGGGEEGARHSSLWDMHTVRKP